MTWVIPEIIRLYEKNKYSDLSARIILYVKPKNAIYFHLSYMKIIK